MVSQLLAFDAAEDEVFAGIGDAIACLIVHVGLLIDRYRHDATGATIVGPINGTNRRLDVTKGLPFRHIPNIAFTCWYTRCAIILALCNSAQAE